MKIRFFLAFLLVWLAAPFVRAQGWSPVPPVDFSSISLSQFDDNELEVPYFLRHFAQVANSVVETGPNQGFLDLKVNREPVDNEPYNARVMENQAALAYFYTANRPWNPYHGLNAVKVRLEAMLARWTQIQNQPGAGDGNFDGLFTEYSPTNWSLAPTGFGVLHAAFSLEAIVNSGSPFDATILENARISLRRALMAIFTRTDAKNTARNYSNQFSGSYYAALSYLSIWPDAGLDAAFTAALGYACENDQSPAGFHHENRASDTAYSGVHQRNLGYALPRLRTRPDLLGEITAAEELWNQWLGATLLPQPGAVTPFYLFNSGINTRTMASTQTSEESPLGEFVPSSQSFARSTTEYAAYLVSRRAQVQAQFGNWGPLAVPSASSYNPNFVFAASTPLNAWQATPAQRAGAFNQLPCFSSSRFNRVLHDAHDSVVLTVSTARRPSYYGIFNSGTLTQSGQNFGLGLLWNARFGTALQSVAFTTWNWGTRPDGGDIYENSAITATRSVDGVTITPDVGDNLLPDGHFSHIYPLGSFGEKSLIFTESGVEVSITHSGVFSEQIPLVYPSSATLTQEPDRLIITQGNGSSLSLTVTGGAASISMGATFNIGSSGLVRRLVNLTSSTSLSYGMKMNSGLPALVTGVPRELDVLAYDTSSPTPLTLESVSFAPPEPLASQPHGNVVIDAPSATTFAPSDLNANAATAPSALAAIPGFTVLDSWRDTQSPVRGFISKGSLTGITNYHARSGPAQAALRFQLETTTTGNPSAGGVSTTSTLAASPAEAIYLGAIGSAPFTYAVTFGRYAALSQTPATLGFSTTSPAGSPIACRAAGFILTNIAETRSFTAQFIGIRGQILATQTGTGDRPAGTKIHFGLDSGTDPAHWISAIVIRGNNGGTNAGLDDFGFSPPTVVDLGTATIVNNRLRYSPSPGYLGPVRYRYTYSFPDGNVTTVQSGTGETSVDIVSADWTNSSSPGLLGWSTATNWSGDRPPIPARPNKLSFFNGATLPAGNITTLQDIAPSLPLQSLILGGTSADVSGVTLGGDSIAFGSLEGAPPVIRLDASQSPQGVLDYLVNTPLTMTSDLAITGDGNASFTLAGVISGSSSLTKSGTSTVSLTGSNTYQGSTAIAAGVLRVSNAAALGTSASTLFMPGGTSLATLELAGNIEFSRNIELAMHSTVGHPQIRNHSGSNTLSGPLRLNPGGGRWEITSLAGSLTVSGPVSNVSGGTDMWRTLTLNGPADGVFTGTINDSASGNSKLNLLVASGEWTLSTAAKTYTGTTTVAGGALRVDTSLSSPIIIQSSATLAGAGSTSSTTTVKTGAIFAKRMTDWDVASAPFSTSQLIATGATSWIIRLDATGLSNFSESPRTIPLVSTSGGLVNVNPNLITIQPVSFPGSGTWSLSTDGNALSLIYTPDAFLVWTASKPWNGADSSATADPDLDSLTNLMEYALGSDPLASSPAAMPVLTTSGSFLALTFDRIPDPKLRYEIIPSSDLTNWLDPIWSSTGATNTPGAVTVTDSVAIGGDTRRFLRLRVSR